MNQIAAEAQDIRQARLTFKDYYKCVIRNSFIYLFFIFFIFSWCNFSYFRFSLRASFRNQDISDAAFNFSDQIINGTSDERSVIVKQMPKAVSLAAHFLS